MRRQLLKSDTATQRYGNRNQELEPEPCIIYANYRTLSLLETEVIIFFSGGGGGGGGRIVSEQFVKISLNHEEQYSSVKSLVYIYIALPKCLTKYNLEPYISKL